MSATKVLGYGGCRLLIIHTRRPGARADLTETDAAYVWAGPNYGASNSLANQMADADRDRLRLLRRLGFRWG